MTRKKVLDKAQREQVRKEYLAYLRGYGYLAKKFNVGVSTVRDIVTGRVS